MVQIGQDFGFAQELSLDFRGGIQVFFQGARAAQGCIPGAIHRAEAALAKQFDDAITVVQNRAGLKNHAGKALQSGYFDYYDADVILTAGVIGCLDQRPAGLLGG